MNPIPKNENPEITETLQKGYNNVMLECRFNHVGGIWVLKVFDPSEFFNSFDYFSFKNGNVRIAQKPRAKNQSQGLLVEKIVFDFIEECEIPLMKVDSDIDVEEDLPFAGPSLN